MVKVAAAAVVVVAAPCRESRVYMRTSVPVSVDVVEIFVSATFDFPWRASRRRGRSMMHVSHHKMIVKDISRSWS